MAYHTTGDSMDDDLAQLDRAYKEATIIRKDSFNESIPDGHYTVLIRNVELTRTRTTGNPMLRWELEITGPTTMGKSFYKNRVITERTLPYLKEELETCGLDLTAVSELPRHLSRLIDMELAVTKRTTDKGENIYFNRRLAKGHEAESDVPF